MLLFITAAGTSYAQSVKRNNEQVNLNKEVIYHIFLRSFYDSNGDHIGDFNGLKEKLGYIQKLGANAILITPIFKSPFYHDYFPSNFDSLDPKYGTKKQFISLLKAIHKRGMKLYLDMEVQYVPGDNPWFKDSYHNPSSPYSNYIIYNGPGNTKPEPTVFNIKKLNSYDGKSYKIATLNLYNPKVQNYIYDIFKFWVDPNHDGNFDDGVDGFRIDHMMDNLDWKGKITGMLSKFWRPLIHQLHEINPKVVIIGEQAAWGYGKGYFSKSNLTAVFAFPLSRAIRKFDPVDIANKIDTTNMITPKNKYQLIFIENHDMPRIASVYKGNISKLKIAATLNLLLKGVPDIYYGQELGMKGVNGFGKYGTTDGNDIPAREAFEWYKSDRGKGMALWYKNTGPWWTHTYDIPDDGISLQEEIHKKNSLWNFYRRMIHLRTGNNIIESGNYTQIPNNNKKEIFTFARSLDNKTVFVALNFSNKNQTVICHLPKSLQSLANQKSKSIFSLNEKAGITPDGKNLTTKLKPYDVQVWQFN